jgi:hypothetical protein
MRLNETVELSEGDKGQISKPRLLRLVSDDLNRLILCLAKCVMESDVRICNV